MILLVIVLLLFGARRLPELGRSLGTGMREFKDSVTGNDDTPAERPAVTAATEQPAAAPPPAPAPATPTAPATPSSESEQTTASGARTE